MSGVGVGRQGECAWAGGELTNTIAESLTVFLSMRESEWILT